MQVRAARHVIDVLKTRAIADANVLRAAGIIAAARGAGSSTIDRHDIDWARAELDKLTAAPETSALKDHVGGPDQISKEEFSEAFERLERAFLTGRGLWPMLRRGVMRVPSGRTLDALPLVSSEHDAAIQAANEHGLDVIVATDGEEKIIGVNERGDLGARHVREVALDDGTQVRLVPVEAVGDVVNGFTERYVDLWQRISKPFQEKWIDGTAPLPSPDTSAITTATAIGIRSLMRGPMTALRRSAAAGGALLSAGIGFALGTVPEMVVHVLADLLPALTGFAAVAAFTLPRAIRAELGSRNYTPLLAHAGVHLSRPATLAELS